ncbi:two-component system response regulator [Methylomonas sp. LW13]|uniref:HD-GYP domain-containing protein n=1 Tax=unclassified Methylomonas TaxID=2608980 RepID=UPI00051BE032|nr:HD domain-containing phosphohydrolase [Methylomonas sp. LW13]QBC29810.1 two-component system response regulator [Methylomonas sp. LW13]
MPNGPILIIDDEPQNLRVLEQILAGKYKLVFARNGHEALAATRKFRPSLILLDIQLPDMDGYTVCRKLKADPLTESIPVIFITSLADADDEVTGFEAGAVDYIVKPVSSPTVRARVQTHLSLVRAIHLEKSHRDAIYMLGEAGHYNDNDTGVHIWRMADYAGALARALGWGEEQCRLIELAAPMHDTGKIGIPDAILKKSGALDASEWIIMKTHPRIGYDILSKSDAPVFKMAAEIALHHHEHWDGSGYPDGLAGELIPESARIAALVDVFDALTMKRPYKEAWPNEQAIATIQAESDSHFQPAMIEVFIAVLPEILAIQTKWAECEATSRV